MKVSIVIPCYNEKATIEKIVVAARAAPIGSREIIVVDDCSQDGTRAVLEEKVSRMVDRIIYHQVNRGKGAALRSGFAVATGDIILVQDADLRYQPGRLSGTPRASYLTESGRGLRLSIHGRPTASRSFFLAHGRKQVSDPAFKHVHEP